MSPLPVLLREFAATTEDPSPLVPLPSRWTFYADRTVDHSPIGPIRPVAFGYTSLLSDFGNASVRLPVRGTPFAPEDLLAFWSWRLWAYYAGKPVWCGCPTGLTDNGAETVDITLTELSGYLTQRQYAAGPKDYLQVEQTVIASDLAGVVANVGVTVLPQAGSGVIRDRHYGYLEGQSRAELLTNLSGVKGGPEFRTEYSIDPATLAPRATLRIAYPRVGTDVGLGLTVPGNVIGGYSAQWDSDRLRTRTYAMGDLPASAPQGAVQPVIVVPNPPTNPNTPQIDKLDKWDGVTLLSTLQERADTASQVYASPSLQISGSVFESNPLFGTYAVGDTVTVRARTTFTPAGEVTTARLVAITVDAATGKVDWTLALTQPPARPRASLSRRLADLDGLTSQMFKRNPVEEV